MENGKEIDRFIGVLKLSIQSNVFKVNVKSSIYLIAILFYIDKMDSLFVITNLNLLTNSFTNFFYENVFFYIIKALFNQFFNTKNHVNILFFVPFICINLHGIILSFKKMFTWKIKSC